MIEKRQPDVWTLFPTLHEFLIVILRVIRHMFQLQLIIEEPQPDILTLFTNCNFNCCKISDSLTTEHISNRPSGTHFVRFSESGL